ncbi:hypothetical protein BP5796_04890 [Coleophoma crateriformis]|uniref:Heme peroxidase n=1 Tax=Coleophoma crateriformis TaxID=565419 RepID=A0A3D8SAK3_9HELO|nr:hypothetical protein BP5796_04890 [Coleophoma crateriformis]
MSINGSIRTVVDTVLKPVPTATDGRYDSEAVPVATQTGLISDILSQLNLKRVPENLALIEKFVQTKRNGGLIDDKTYLTEDIIQLAASLPTTSANANKLTGLLIGSLWNSMQHPPVSYLGNEYKYRQPDGSCNNIMYPNLGKAGSAYARSVQPKTQLSATLPDPGLVFDTLLARNEGFREHPTKISSMLFYFATIIIHDLFSTSHADPSCSNSSSYLDLGPLYGNNKFEQDGVRTFQDGKLKPDCFAAYRILGFPPGVAALLVCFNRYHNYIVGELATINESNKFAVPTLDKSLEKRDHGKAQEALNAAKLKRDEDLFQTGRLINCGLYVNIVLIDYVRTILNLNRSNSTWALDPRGTFDTVFDMAGTPTGIGNQVSVEFNLIYRWHCATSQKDEQWTKDFFKYTKDSAGNLIWPDRDPSTFSVEELYAGLRVFSHDLDKDPGKWTWDGMKRKSDGSFDDAKLNQYLRDGSEDVAGAFGARNIPNVMKVIEVLGMQQAREWNVASLNEFRKFFGLEPHKTFSDINDDPEVAQSLEVLYDHPDLVELYPGLLTESAKKPMVPGSGLCPGFTISRAVLSDAVTLVRGDRFYTEDYNPAHLTHWGFNEVATDPKIAQGGVFYKLLMRAFPDFYPGNSAYAQYPFTIPSEVKKIHTELGTVSQLDFSPPKHQPKPTALFSYAACKKVLDDQVRFKVPWGPNTYALTKHDYMLSGDKPSNKAQRDFVQKQLYCPHNALDGVRQFYEKITLDLLRAKSYKLRDIYQVDAVRDVGNTSHANFAAQLFHIPIKTADHPLGLFTEQELYLILAVVFAYVFLDADPATDQGLKNGGLAAIEPLSKAVHAVVTSVNASSFLAPIRNMLNGHELGFVNDYGTNLIKRLSQGGKSADEVTWTIIPTAAAAVATQAQGFAQMLDLYLSEPYKKDWKAIQQAAQSNAPEDFQKLRKYALEGYRLATPSFGLVRIAAEDGIVIDDGKKKRTFNIGDRVFTNFVSACMDPTVFPEPQKVKLDRPEELYIHHGSGPHACLGKPMVITSMAAQLRVFGRLKNLRRTPGVQGELKHKMLESTIRVYMKEDWGSWWPFPTTMKVQFDGFEEGLCD